MPIYRRTPGSLCRLLLPLAAVAVANIALSVSAQTVPQLLPYTAKLIAGGGPTATFTVNPSAYCPQAGAPYTPADKYGDGCLANEIQLTGPRYAIADSLGNVFISDYTNGLVRRVDAITGIITAVAGSATVTTTPGKNAPCTTGSRQSVSSSSGKARMCSAFSHRALGSMGSSSLKLMTALLRLMPSKEKASTNS